MLSITIPILINQLTYLPPDNSSYPDGNALSWSTAISSSWNLQMKDSTSVQEGHFSIFSSILPVTWIQVMLLVPRQVSGYPCVPQSTVRPSLIYNAVLPCLRIGSILGISCESISGSPEMCFHQTSCTAWRAAFRQSLWLQTGMNACVSLLPWLQVGNSLQPMVGGHGYGQFLFNSGQSGNTSHLAWKCKPRELC